MFKNSDYISKLLLEKGQIVFNLGNYSSDKKDKKDQSEQN